MMMNLQSQRKRGRLRSLLFNKTMAVVLAVAAVVAVFQFWGDRLLATPLQVVAEPVWQFRATVVDEAALLWESFAPERTLVAENRRLRERVAELERNALAQEALVLENEQLKMQLSRGAEYGPVLATILVRPPVSPYDTFIIDAGSRAGISVGDLVMVPDYFVVGKVTAVFLSTARVQLFSAPGVRSLVHIGKAYVPAEAIGRGGDTFEAQLPRDIKVAEGDIVLFPHISTLVFATVENIAVEPTDSFQTVFFRNPVNMQNVRFVMVLTDTPETPLQWTDVETAEAVLNTTSTASMSTTTQSSAQDSE